MNKRSTYLLLALLCLAPVAEAANPSDILWLSDIAPKRAKKAAEAGHANHDKTGKHQDNMDAVIGGEEGDNLHSGAKRLWLRQGDDPVKAAVEPWRPGGAQVMERKVGLGQLLAGQFEHWWRKVTAPEFTAELVEQNRQIGGPSSQIENGLTSLGLGQFDDGLENTLIACKGEILIFTSRLIVSLSPGIKFGGWKGVIRQHQLILPGFFAGKKNFRSL